MFLVLFSLKEGLVPREKWSISLRKKLVTYECNVSVQAVPPLRNILLTHTRLPSLGFLFLPETTR